MWREIYTISLVAHSGSVVGCWNWSTFPIATGSSVVTDFEIIVKDPCYVMLIYERLHLISLDQS